jgi:hypothetical protein
MSDSYHYNPATPEDYSFQCLVTNTVSEEACIEWLMRIGLIPSCMLCPKCSSGMSLDLKKRRWRCGRSTKHVGSGDVERSCTAGTFFERSKLKLTSIVWIIYAWSSRMSHKTAGEMSGASQTSVSDWYSYCRDICSSELLQCDAKVPRHTI